MGSGEEVTDPDPPEEPPPDAFSAAALRDAVESAEDESIAEGEGRDRHR